MRIIVALDTQESGEEVFIGVYVEDDDGNPIVGIPVDVRDYGRGDTVDEDGNLYLPMTS